MPFGFSLSNPHLPNFVVEKPVECNFRRNFSDFLILVSEYNRGDSSLLNFYFVIILFSANVKCKGNCDNRFISIIATTCFSKKANIKRENPIIRIGDGTKKRNTAITDTVGGIVGSPSSSDTISAGGICSKTPIRKLLLCANARSENSSETGGN